MTRGGGKAVAVVYGWLTCDVSSTGQLGSKHGRSSIRLMRRQGPRPVSVLRRIVTAITANHGGDGIVAVVTHGDR